MKTCSRCGVSQPLEQFVKSDRYRDGKHPHCKTCRKALRLALLEKTTFCKRCGVNPRSQSNFYCEPCQREMRGRTPEVKFHPRKDGICPRCGINPKSNDRGYCEECCCDYNNQWFKKRGGYWNYLSPEGKKRAMAREAVHKAVKRGKMEKYPCEICGCVESEGHHYAGYEKEYWLVVLWVCREHHKDCHSEKIKVDVHQGGVVVVTIGVAVTK